MSDRPRATYSFLNESQAQIAHHCLEPELPGEGGKGGAGREREKKREGRFRFGTLYGIINSKAEISLCRKDLSFVLGCTLVTKDSFPLGLLNTVVLPADLPLRNWKALFSITLEIRTTASLLAQGSQFSLET